MKKALIESIYPIEGKFSLLNKKRGDVIMKGKLLGVISAVLVVVSMVSASTASWLVFYQPKAPKNLHK